jgi:hypothetical protein
MNNNNQTMDDMRGWTTTSKTREWEERGERERERERREVEVH